MDPHVELIVFFAQGVLFGAYARQVAEIVHTEEQYTLSENGLFPWGYRDENCQGIDLRFCLNQYSIPKNLDVSIERVLPSKLLLITSSDCLYRAVWVDGIDEFLTVPLECFHTLPIFMQKMGHFPALWGIACHEDSMILLLDLFRLPCSLQSTCR